jgi:hypothetical protein
VEGVEEGRFALASTRRIPQHRSTRTPAPPLAPSPLGNPALFIPQTKVPRHVPYPSPVGDPALGYTQQGTCVLRSRDTPHLLAYTLHAMSYTPPIPLTCWRPSPPARCTCTQTAARAPAVTPRSAKETALRGMPRRCQGDAPRRRECEACCAMEGSLRIMSDGGGPPYYER